MPYNSSGHQPSLNPRNLMPFNSGTESGMTIDVSGHERSLVDLDVAEAMINPEISYAEESKTQANSAKTGSKLALLPARSSDQSTFSSVKKFNIVDDETERIES